jgi:hypothetical protein
VFLFHVPTTSEYSTGTLLPSRMFETLGNTHSNFCICFVYFFLLFNARRSKHFVVLFLSYRDTNGGATIGVANA